MTRPSHDFFLLLAFALVLGCGDESVSTRDPTDSPDGGGESASGDYCMDDAFGSGALAMPTSDDAHGFTTVLEVCALSAAEAADCYGAEPQFGEMVAGDVRTITGNAIPNHDTDLYPNAGNPNVISPQALAYSMTTAPSRNATPSVARVVGVALNGIKLEPETAEVYADTAWRYEALTFNGRLDGDTNFDFGASLGLDCNFAHVQPTGEYHYHGVPTGLMPEAPAITLVAWAADGYPILGRYGHETAGDAGSAIVALRGSYQVRAGARAALDGETPPPGDYDGTFVQDWEYDPSVGDLDECNGRVERITIGDETFDYAYYLTHTYPYMPRCVWGDVDDSFAAGPGGMGGMAGMGGGPPRDTP